MGKSVSIHNGTFIDQTNLIDQISKLIQSLLCNKIT
uniref:Uncharacterized protein n=1 Tax=viral metagenome TaxID=1070528 RepID=A0A6C0BJM4_9ZZZZ